MLDKGYANIPCNLKDKITASTLQVILGIKWVQYIIQNYEMEIYFPNGI